MKIVAVAACTLGVAHTYMAKTAIEQECIKRGHEVKVETQGAVGIENELSVEEIRKADAVLLAISVAIEGAERFENKFDQGKVLQIDPASVIKSSAKIIDKIESV